MALRTNLRNHAIARLRCQSYELFRAVFAAPMQASAPDLVHCHDSMPLLAAQSVAKATDAALVYDSHEFEAHRNIFMPPYLKAKIIGVETQVLPDTDAVITVSDGIADDLSQMYGIARPLVVHNAPPRRPMPLSPRWQQASRGASLRREAGISDDAVLIVYTGNVVVNRGIEQTIAGLAEYYRTTPAPRDVHFSMVGSAKDGTADVVRAQVAAAGLVDKVHFHAPVPPTEVTSFIAAADIAVVSVIPVTRSYDYAMPNKLFEAAMAGLPILGADLAAQGPFIKKHKLGVTYDPLSASSFCSALTEMLAHFARYKRDSAAQDAFDNAFSWEAQGRKITDLYARIAKARGREIRRVAMVVPNPCDPDFRVVKEAQSVAAAGYDVTLFATRARGSDLPDTEHLNGVTYVRCDWHARAAARGLGKQMLGRRI
ncbi:MAG: glycosyltransferase [Thalassovita sp.]